MRTNEPRGKAACEPQGPAPQLRPSSPGTHAALGQALDKFSSTPNVAQIIIVSRSSWGGFKCDCGLLTCLQFLRRQEELGDTAGHSDLLPEAALPETAKA